MKRNFTKKLLIVLTVLAVMGIGSTGFAYKGQCFGNQSDDYYCRGGQKGGHGCGAAMQNRGCGKGLMGKQGAGGKGCLRKGAALNEDQIKQLTEACNAFQESTKELRSQINSKRLELESEFVKTKPDVEKLKTLQKELSELKAQFAQKRMEQRLKMKAVHPDMPCAKGWKSGGGFGKGKGAGRGCGRAM
ncbi:periplasmic heavy metal sensor [Desulfococcaceae bacterium HSG9]|nr:periplasmic heavy metal sensor [Desulfococcaceae bacterium HSG9]